MKTKLMLMTCAALVMGCGEKQTGKTAMHPEPVVVSEAEVISPADLERVRELAEIDVAIRSHEQHVARLARVLERCEEMTQEEINRPDTVPAAYETVQKFHNETHREWLEAQSNLNALKLRRISAE
jgi:hypothetical protein